MRERDRETERESAKREHSECVGRDREQLSRMLHAKFRYIVVVLVVAKSAVQYIQCVPYTHLEYHIHILNSNFTLSGQE